jgi:hypothetical protein
MAKAGTQANATANANVDAIETPATNGADNGNGESGEEKRKYTRRNTVSFARDKKNRLVVTRSGGEDSEDSVKYAFRFNEATNGFEAIDTDTYNVVAQAGTRNGLIEAVLVRFGILETEG